MYPPPFPPYIYLSRFLSVSATLPATLYIIIQVSNCIHRPTRHLIYIYTYNISRFVSVSATLPAALYIFIQVSKFIRYLIYICSGFLVYPPPYPPSYIYLSKFLSVSATLPAILYIFVQVSKCIRHPTRHLIYLSRLLSVSAILPVTLYIFVQVSKCIRHPTSHLLREDGRYLDALQPVHSLYRGKQYLSKAKLQ